MILITVLTLAREEETPVKAESGDPVTVCDVSVGLCQAGWRRRILICSMVLEVVGKKC